jgi:hypothetical protein
MKTVSSEKIAPGATMGFPFGRPVAAFNSLIVPSSPPLARVLPSGLNATELTTLVWPVRGLPTG